MHPKIEGTIILEGLVEGPLPPFPDAQAKIERWTRGDGAPLRMSLQMDGGHFSLMPSDEPMHVKTITRDGGDPANAIADALSDLLRTFPPAERSQVFSTLRSTEYRPKLKVETLYAVGPDGRAVTRDQTSPCETVPPEEPISRKELITRGAIGLGIALAILGISALFVDYPKLWRQWTARVEQVSVTINTGTFAKYFSVEVKGLDRRNNTILLRLARTAAFPRTEADLDALDARTPASTLQTRPSETGPATSTKPAAASSPGALRQRLAIEALGRGVVRIEFRDQENHLLGQQWVRIADLQSSEAIETAVPVPTSDGRILVPASIDILP